MVVPKPLQVVAALVLIYSSAATKADENHTILFDFSKPDAVKHWQTVNDGVMGGVSSLKEIWVSIGDSWYFSRHLPRR